MGIGIGICLIYIINLSMGYNNKLSNSEIEEEARGFGMHYSDECKVLFGEEDIND